MNKINCSLSISICLAVVMTFPLIMYGQGSSHYQVSRSLKIGGSGGWDYIAVYDNKLYVSHGTQVNIIDEKTGDSIAVVPNTPGVHGIAFVPEANHGYISCGRTNVITVFDLKTNAVTGEIAVGQNPDAIMYDPFSRKIITCNGRSNDLSIVDPFSGKVENTIKLSGKPETAVSDEQGKIFVNIEDKNSISVVDIKKGQVLNTWSIAPGDGPTGLAIDLQTKRLFAGCDKMMIVINSTDGKIINKLPIGDGCDGIAFDNNRKMVFASCGEGVLSIATEDASGNCTITDSVKTKRSARTITCDPVTHEVFMPAAEYGTAEKGQRPPVIPGTFQIIVCSAK